MNLQFLHEIGQWLGLVFPPEWVQAALVLALFSTIVVVTLFAHLNHYSRKRYFGKWTMAWIFYGAFLIAAIALENEPKEPFFTLTRRACLGISALYLFYGSLEFAHRQRSQREMLFAVLMIVAWSGVASYHLANISLVTFPMFVLLSCASIYTGALYFHLRGKYRGAGVLAFGFMLWGLHLMVFPLFGRWRWLDAVIYLSSALIALTISMGMMVQMLEEAREHNESLVNEFQKGLAKSRALEQEVSHIEQRYRALFEASSDAAFLVDLDDHMVIEVNQSAYRLFSRNGGALVGASFTDICPGLQPLSGSPIEDRKRYEEFFRIGDDLQLFRTDGTRFRAQGEAKLVNNNKRPMMQVSVHEVSEQEQAEKKLRKAEKLSALGTLIAGVAHELNNPLSVIMGYAQLLSQRSTSENNHRAELKKIFHESERAAKIVRNLLTFARPRDPEMSVVDLNAIAQNVVESYARYARTHEVQVETRWGQDIPFTKADSNQVEQVMANLIANGIQAMGEKQDDLRLLRVSTSVYGAFVRVTVEDTGPGIPAEIITRIFDPFYTTKAPGKGTGLGLSICQTIVEEHHGRIWVQSEAGSGAKVFVELPIVACAGEQTIDRYQELPNDDDSVKRRRGCRILLVDDEPGILEVLKESLTYRGYIIDTAESGKVALERLQHDRYDLIVSDLKMPDVDGEKMYHAIRKQYPRLADRIIFLTGDTVSSKARNFLEWTNNHWFSKPFNMIELETVIDNYLILPSTIAENEELTGDEASAGPRTTAASSAIAG